MWTIFENLAFAHEVDLPMNVILVTKNLTTFDI